jgi:transposase
MSEGTTRYLGLDVHKATITVAVAEESGPATVYGTIANEPGAVRKLVRQLGREARLVAAYEAGPTGYALHRELTRLGVECTVAAPSLIPVRPGDRRIKTDSRDALALARLLRNGDLTPVWVPDPEHEALRDLVRTRYDAKDDLRRARHRLAKFLLRRGCSSPPGVKAWSARYYDWLNQLCFDQTADQIVLDDYRVAEQAAGERVRRLEKALRRCAEQSPQLPLIAALQVLRGIAFLSAVTIVAEVGDFRRFTNAPAFMCFTGLVSSEHSSGSSRRQGAITRAGNPYLRHVLIQGAHNARYVPSLRGAVQQRLDGVPPDLVELALAAQQRLHSRYRHLDRRIGRPKAVTAVARELAGFVWAVGRRMSEAAAA